MNQCDGCARALPKERGIHYDNGRPFMYCTAATYCATLTQLDEQARKRAEKETQANKTPQKVSASAASAGCFCRHCDRVTEWAPIYYAGLDNPTAYRCVYCKDETGKFTGSTREIAKYRAARVLQMRLERYQKQAEPCKK